MSFELRSLVRENIRKLKPYSSARSEFTGVADVFLDANENAFGSPAGDNFNRYPDPLQRRLKEEVARIRKISPDRIFVGNGSDEAIDLLFRIFCTPGGDEVITCPPTYGMYAVSAAINDIADVQVSLAEGFQLNVESILAAIKPQTKLIFICSPNNPSGNLMRRESVIEIARQFHGIVVVDEAYIDFASEPSFIQELDEVPNLVILQTFSKAWGMAGLRVGLAFASADIIDVMNRVKPPYNVSGIAQRAVFDAFGKVAEVDAWIASLRTERTRLASALGDLKKVETVYPSDANFLLMRVANAKATYAFLISEGIVVRDRSTVRLCGECLRITVGTAKENERLMDALRRFSNL